MQYLGGKSRTYKEICAFLESIRKPNQPFVEPFCGGCWVTQGIGGERYAYDANDALITMWRCAQLGYIFPEYIDKDTYSLYQKSKDVADPLTAFIGFGYSFGGKWFGGYCDRRDPKQHLGDPRKSIERKVTRMNDVVFMCTLYENITVRDSLIYCDPPYEGTTQYGAFNGFDHELFWQTMRDWVNKGNIVVVSEYKAPCDFLCVWAKETKTELRTKAGRGDRVEKLFMHESQYKQFFQGSF